jgi:hypothetical protein
MFGGLERTLKKGAAFAKTKDVDESVFLEWRVAPDMFPMKRQVQFATEIPARGLSRLAGAEIPKFDDNEKTFADLYARIKRASDIIGGLSDAALNKDPDAEITVPMGSHEMTFTRTAYLQTFVLPNLYFHTSAAYLILRHLGVEVGKLDFMNAPAP